jgi:hypothetical protein
VPDWPNKDPTETGIEVKGARDQGEGEGGTMGFLVEPGTSHGGSQENLEGEED